MLQTKPRSRKIRQKDLEILQKILVLTVADEEHSRTGTKVDTAKIILNNILNSLSHILYNLSKLELILIYYIDLLY